MYNCDLTIDEDQPFTGIIRYDNASTAIPSTTAPKVPTPDGCLDSPSSLFKPVVHRTVPRPSKDEIVALNTANYAESLEPRVFVWDLANTSLQIDWSNPSLSYAGIESGQPKPFPTSYAPISLDGKPASWKYFVVQGNPDISTLPPHLNQRAIPAPHVRSLKSTMERNPKS